MQKQSEALLLIQNQGLTTLSNPGLILAEQPSKKDVIKILSYLLQRIGRIYQIPNWTEIASVELAEWIFDNYKYDTLEDIITCLKNPPETDSDRPNWRLTPDTVRSWMAVHLEKTVIKRENEQSALKSESDFKIDYEEFYKRLNPEQSEESKLLLDSSFEDFKKSMDKLMNKQK